MLSVKITSNDKFCKTVLDLKSKSFTEDQICPIQCSENRDSNLTHTNFAENGILYEMITIRYH